VELIKQFIDIFLHLDKHLGLVIQSYGVWTYGLLFLIIFCETGLVVMPLLPGDSLLFAAGAFAASGSLDLIWLLAALTVAAVVGDTINYAVGHYVGPRVFAQEKIRFLNKKHLERTHEFYEKYGCKTIIIARFVPIVRTFAPFVAGIGAMSYLRFITYNVVGGVLWVAVCILSGFFFGNLGIVKKNFSLAILAIVFISILPGIVEYLRIRSRSRQR